MKPEEPFIDGRETEGTTVDVAVSESMERWLSSGGELLDGDADRDGPPRRWRCGHDTDGRLTDPPGVDDDVIHFLDHDGTWIGKVAEPEDLDDRDRWRDAA